MSDKKSIIDKLNIEVMEENKRLKEDLIYYKNTLDNYKKYYSDERDSNRKEWSKSTDKINKLEIALEALIKKYGDGNNNDGKKGFFKRFFEEKS